MTEPVLYRKWCGNGEPLLAVLRTQYEYTERMPDRATGWLYAARQIGQLPPMEWPEPLSAIGPALLGDLEFLLGIRFEAACFQAYLDGSGVDWHYDRDWDATAILSLGVTRDFGLRGRSGDQFPSLHDGDLLFMPPGFQHEWEHCVPVQDVTGERCSLVFRTPA